MTKYMGVFRLVGSFTWNEEAAGSSPVSYTKTKSSTSVDGCVPDFQSGG